MARFPKLQELREQHLGWEVSELAAKMPDGKPSVSSIYRLERGEPLRVTNVRRVFDVVNAALDHSLDPTAEILAE